MLKVLDLNGDSQEVEVIRYFKFNGNDYLLYSLNEADEQDYLKLYGVKVVDNTGAAISDEEWTLVKDEIKVIIKANKEGNLNVEDLDFKAMGELTVNDFRAFKLSREYVELLKANKREFTEVAKTEETSEPQAEAALETDNESFEPPAFDFPVETPSEEVSDTPAVDESSQVEQAETPEPDTSGFDLGLETEEQVQSEMPTATDVDNLEPTPVGTVDQPAVEEPQVDTRNYEEMYNEAQEINKVLQSENEELKKRLSRIAQVISE